MKTSTRYLCRNPACTWYRDFFPDDEATFTHPLHGLTTSKGSASRDIMEHNCVKHQEALRRLHGWLTQATRTQRSHANMR